jgi:hypothetical protein
MRSFNLIIFLILTPTLKFNKGSIFGITFFATIITIAIGFASSYFFIKHRNKQTNVPAMHYKNPAYN